tara:strand:+ start:329 stop:583 length:255 start_codon:yes stop_codon:yes gene_type:complete
MHEAQFVITATTQVGYKGEATSIHHLTARDPVAAKLEAYAWLTDRCFDYPDSDWARGYVQLIDRGSTKVLRNSNPPPYRGDTNA